MIAMLLEQAQHGKMHREFSYSLVRHLPMRKSALLAAILWVWLVGGSIVQGFMLRASPLAQINLPMQWPLVVLPAVIVIGGALLTKRVPGASLIGTRVDQTYGHGTYLSFMRLLKPELLCACTSFAIGLVGLIVSGTDVALGTKAFFISGGLSFLVAHFITRWRGLYGAKAA